MKRLAAAGAKVTSRPIPAIGAMRALSAQFGSMVAIEAYAEHRAIFESADAKRMDQRVVKRAMGGRVSERDATNLQRGREELIAALVDELKGALLVLPATPMTAPAHCSARTRRRTVPRHQPARHPLHVSRQPVSDVRPGAAVRNGRRRPADRRPVPCAGRRRRSPAVDRAQHRERAFALRRSLTSPCRTPARSSRCRHR